MVTAAELIAEARARRIAPVTVSGIEFHILRLPATQMVAIGQRAREGAPFQVPDWLAAGVCNPDGSPFFTADEAAEFAEVDGYTAARLADAVAEKAGFGGDPAKN